jgi:hypothetical protein
MSLFSCSSLTTQVAFLPDLRGNFSSEALSPYPSSPMLSISKLYHASEKATSTSLKDSKSFGLGSCDSFPSNIGFQRQHVFPLSTSGLLGSSHVK